MPANLNKISKIVNQCGAVSPEALFNAFCIDYLAPNPSFFKSSARDHQDAARTFIQLYKSDKRVDIRRFLNEYFSSHKLTAADEFAALLKMFLICHPEYHQFLAVDIKKNLPAIKPEQGERKDILNLVLGFETQWREYFFALLEQNKIFKLTRASRNLDKDSMKILSIPSIFESLSVEKKLEIIETIFKKAKIVSENAQPQAFRALSKIFKMIPTEFNNLAVDAKEKIKIDKINSRLKTLKIEIAELFFSKLNIEEQVATSILQSSTDAFKGNFDTLNNSQKETLLDKLIGTIVEQVDYNNFSFGFAIEQKIFCIGMLIDIADNILGNQDGVNNNNTLVIPIITIDTLKKILELFISLLEKPTFDSDISLAVYKAFSKPSALLTGNEIKIIKIILDKIKAKEEEHSQTEAIKASFKLLANLFLIIQKNGIQATNVELQEENLSEQIYQCFIDHLNGAYAVAAIEALTIIYLAESNVVDKTEIIYIFINMIATAENSIKLAAIQSLMALENSIPETCKIAMNETLATAINFNNTDFLVSSMAYIALIRFSSLPKKLDAELMSIQLIDAGIMFLQIPPPARGENHKIFLLRKAVIQNLVAIVNLPTTPDTERSKVFEVCLKNVNIRGQNYKIRMDIKDMLFQMATSTDEKHQLINLLKSDLEAGLSDEANQLMLILRKLSVHTQKDLKLLVTEQLIEHLSSYPARDINSLKSTIIELSLAMDQTQQNYIIFGKLFPYINSVADLGTRAHLIHVLCEICEDRLISSKINNVMEDALVHYKKVLNDAGKEDSTEGNEMSDKMKEAYKEYLASIETKGVDGCRDILQVVNAYRR